MEPDRPSDDGDFGNPYAPPRSSFSPEVVPAHFAGIPFGIDDIMRASWSIFKQHAGTCLWLFWGTELMILGLAFGVTKLLNEMQSALAGNQQVFGVVYILLNFMAVVVQVWLRLGRTRGLIKLVRGEPVAFDVIFSGGPYVLTIILASIVVAVLVAVAFFFPLMVMSVLLMGFRNQLIAGILVVLACCVLFIVMAFYLVARLAQSYYLVVDRGAGVLDSIRLSWRMTKGRAGTIILVYLVQLSLWLAGLLACCAGLIFTLPFGSLILVVTFLAMVSPVKPPGQVPLVRWEDDP